MQQKLIDIFVFVVIVLCLYGLFTLGSDIARSNQSKTSNSNKEISLEVETETLTEPKKVYQYKYDGKNKKVRVNNTTEFRSLCKEFEYEKLTDYPEFYVDSPILVKLQVYEELTNVSNYYICVGYNSNAYMIQYNLEEEISSGDIKEIYGIYRGVMEIQSSSGTTIQLPLVEVVVAKELNN